MPSDASNGDRLYRRLDVAPGASAEQIGRAYRRLAHSVHPDAHPENPDDAAIRFREITEAYEILSDPARRARYDRNRQPPTTSDVRPAHGAANPTRIAAGTPPIHTPGQEGSPISIGLGSFRSGSPPLIAGPVHVASPGARDGAAAYPTSGSELAQLIDVVLRAWRWR